MRKLIDIAQTLQDLSNAITDHVEASGQAKDQWIPKEGDWVEVVDDTLLPSSVNLKKGEIRQVVSSEVGINQLALFLGGIPVGLRLDRFKPADPPRVEEVLPGPLEEVPEEGTKYWAENLNFPEAPLYESWEGDEIDMAYLQAGLIFPYTDLGRKAAIERGKRGLVKLYEPAKPLEEEPKNGEKYYQKTFDRSPFLSRWDNQGIDKERFLSGNCYPFTPQGALAAALHNQTNP